MADQKLNVKISGDSKELDQSLKNTAKEIRKVSQEATRAQQTASKNVAKVADELGKAGTQGAKGLGKMVMGMSSVAAWGGVVVSAIQKIHEVWEGFVVRGFERAIELSKMASESISESSDANVRRWQNATSAIKTYYDTLDKYQKNPTAKGFEELRRAGRAKAHAGLPSNIEGLSEGQQLLFAHQQEYKAIDDAINALNKEQEKLDNSLADVAGRTFMKPATKNELIGKMQLQKDANAKELRGLITRKHSLEQQHPGEDWLLGALAEGFDEARQKLAKAQEAQAKELENLKKAQASYQQALNESRRAEQELKNVKEQQKRERKAEMMDSKRERLQKKMDAFGFSLPEDFDVNLKGKALSDRRRQKALDASISDKISRQEAGQRVHWTTQERKRIQEFQKLEKKDKNIEAAQKQMEAADKQKAAADALMQASNTLKGAKNVEGWWRNTGVPTARKRYFMAGKGSESAYNELLQIFASRLAVENAKDRLAEAQNEARKKADAELEQAKSELADVIKQMAQLEWNASRGKHNAKNRQSNHGYDPVVRGILEENSARKITEDNAKWLEGIYNNTKDFGGHIYIVK